jgi:hypothetical protein
VAALLQAAARRNERRTQRILRQAVKFLVGPLSPQETAGLAGWALDAMDRTTDPLTRSACAEALASMAGCLGPREALPLARRVLRTIAGPTPPYQAYPMAVLARSLGSLARRLRPAEVIGLADEGLQALARATDRAAQDRLFEAVILLSDHLGPGEAAGAFGKALDGGEPHPERGFSGPATRSGVRR